MSKETIDKSTKYIQDVASKAHSNIKTFIQPENLKAFASKASENIQKAVKPENINENIDSFNYNYPRSSLFSMFIELLVYIWIFYYWNPGNFFSDHRQLTILFLLMWGFVQLMAIFYYRERRANNMTPPIGEDKPTVNDVIIKLSQRLLCMCCSWSYVYTIFWTCTHFATIFQWGVRCDY